MAALLPGARLSSWGGNPHAVNGSWEIARPQLIDRSRLDPTQPAADLLRVHARALSSLLCLCLVCLTCHRLSHDLSTCVRSASLRWRSSNQHDQVSLFPNPRLDLQRYRGAPHHSPCARCRQQSAADRGGLVVRHERLGHLRATLRTRARGSVVHDVMSDDNALQA